MIKLEELRLNNWVFDKLGRPVQILEIREETFITKLSNGSKLKYHYHTSNPIPLTPEWLEKRFGMVTLDNEIDYIEWGLSDNEDPNGDLFCVCCDGFDETENIYFEYDLGKGVTVKKKIEYVHQLQSLYFALTGKELELKQ